MEYYTGEYNLENIEKFNFIDEILSGIYFLHITYKYKSKFNYIEQLINTEYKKSKKETLVILKKQFTEDDLAITKLDLSILNSLYLHYYKISYNAGKLSFKARRKWIINVLISDINKQGSFQEKHMVILEFKKNLSKTLKYIDLISNYSTCKNLDIINDHARWVKLIRNLKDDNVINEENAWINLGPAYSTPKTQICILIFILRKNNFFNTTTQKLINEVMRDFFKISFSDSNYNEKKTIIRDEMGMDSTNQYFKIYIKLKSYI